MTTPVENSPATATPTAPGATYCPYLGRREADEEPCGYATRHNVCHAQPGHGNRSYTRVSRETQMVVCLEPAGGWPQCRHFLDAMAAERPTLREMPGEICLSAPVRSRHRRRSRWRKLRHRLTRRFGVIIAGSFVLLISALLGLLVARTVAWLW
jgi:hypothetical protein